MKRMKRALCLLLTTVMVLGCLSGLRLTASAETVEYDLWIGGLQVTSDNCQDVLGDGTISYDQAASTLYLNNANVTSGTKSSAVIYNDTGSDLTIDVTGVNEIGSTFTIQGFDLSYVGVILGPSVQFKNGQIVFCPEFSKNDKATQNRSLSDGTKSKFGDILLRNEVKVLLTRGVKGLYIYACDPALREALKDIAKI